MTFNPHPYKAIQASTENNLRQWIENHEKLRPFRDQQHAVFLASIDLIRNKLSALAEQIFLSPQTRDLQKQLNEQLEALNQDRKSREEKENEFQNLFALIKTGVETLNDHSAPRSLISELLQKKNQADQTLEQSVNDNTSPQEALQIMHQLMPSDVQWQDEGLLNTLLQNDDIEATFQQGWRDKKNNKPNYFDQVDEALKTSGFDHIRVMWSGLDAQLKLSAAYKEIYEGTQPEELARNAVAWRETFSQIQNLLALLSINEQEVALHKAFYRTIKEAIINGDADKVDILLLEAPRDFDCQRALETAVNALEPEIIDKLLKAYPNVNRTHALAAAAGIPLYGQVKKLLEGNPVGLNLVPALIAAARPYNEQIVEELLSSPLVNLDADALLTFAKAGLTDLVDKLLSRNPTVNRADALEVSLKNLLDLNPEDPHGLNLPTSRANYEKVVNRLLSDTPLDLVTRALMRAMDAGRLDKIRKLLYARTDIDYSLALVDAVRGGKPRVVNKFLQLTYPRIDCGPALVAAVRAGRADMVDAMYLYTNHTDLGPAFVAAIHGGHLGILDKFLVDASDADLEASFAAAIRAKNSKIVNKLLLYLPDPYIDLAPAVTAAARMNDVTMINTLLLNTSSTLDGSRALVVAARAGHEDIVHTLLANNNVILSPGALALAAIAGGDRPTMASDLQAHPLASPSYAKSFVDAAAANDINKVESLLSNGADDVHLVWALETAAHNGHLEIIDRLLPHASENINFAHALEAAARNGHLEIVDRLLNYPSANLNRDSALEAAARNGHAEIIRSLMRNAPLTLDCDWAVEAAAAAGHVGIVNTLLSSKNWEELANARRLAATAGANNPQVMAIVNRPRIHFNGSSQYSEKESSEARQRWIKLAMGLQHRADSEIAPPLSHAIQSWLPDSLRFQEREDITKKFQLIEDNPDPEIRESVKAFAAFVYLAEGTSDFKNHKRAYKARMWNLLEALVDKNQASLGEVSDQDHVLLRERVMATSAAALEACTDRLSKGFEILEKVIELDQARSFTTMEEHTGLAKKMYGDYLKDRLAHLKAIELKMDGYRFPSNHVFPDGSTAQSIKRSINKDEQLEIAMFYDSEHMDKKYQSGNTPKTMAYVNLIVAREKQANPIKTAGRRLDQIIEDLSKEAEEILAELSNEKGESAKLEVLIDSANKVLLKDGRDVLPAQANAFVMTFEDFMAREYGPFDDFAKKEFPELTQPAIEYVNKLKAEEKVLENKISSQPKFVSRPQPTAPDENADQAVKDQYHAAVIQHRVDHQRDLQEHVKVYEQWEQMPSDEGKIQKDLYEDWTNKSAERYAAERNALPDVLKNLYLQYTSTKPIIDDLKKERGKGYACKWEPLGLPTRQNPPAIYTVSRNTGEGNTYLMITEKNKPDVIFSINTKRFNLLRGESEDAIPPINDKVQLQWADGKLQNIIPQNVELADKIASPNVVADPKLRLIAKAKIEEATPATEAEIGFGELKIGPEVQPDDTTRATTRETALPPKAYTGLLRHAETPPEELDDLKQWLDEEVDLTEERLSTLRKLTTMQKDRPRQWQDVNQAFNDHLATVTTMRTELSPKTLLDIRAFFTSSQSDRASTLVLFEKLKEPGVIAPEQEVKAGSSNQGIETKGLAPPPTSGSKDIEITHPSAGTEITSKPSAKLPPDTEITQLRLSPGKYLLQNIEEKTNLPFSAIVRAETETHLYLKVHGAQFVEDKTPLIKIAINHPALPPGTALNAELTATWADGALTLTRSKRTRRERLADQVAKTTEKIKGKFRK